MFYGSALQLWIFGVKGQSIEEMVLQPYRDFRDLWQKLVEKIDAINQDLVVAIFRQIWFLDIGEVYFKS